MPWSSRLKGLLPRPRSAGFGFGLLIAAGSALIPASPRAQQQAQERLLKPFAAAIATAPASTERSGSIYVPVYAHLPVDTGAFDVKLSVTLSIRNTSPSKVIAIRRIKLFDTSGEFVESYLSTPIGLRPYGTVNFFTSYIDHRGGSGGNFVVDWGGDTDISEPIMETIMLGEFGGRGYSFVSRGVDTKITPPASLP
jgi:hypothetical protein